MIPRIGIGYDVHRLEAGVSLIIGGISIPHHKGAKGHSDADVLIHAICDALLGAASLGDIGTHFPDTDKKYKGINSCLILKEVVKMLHDRHFRIGNIDTVVILQKPKIASYTGAMRNKLAPLLGLTEEDVSVKATTTEKLGFEGSEEGIAAHAVALIFKV